LSGITIKNVDKWDGAKAKDFVQKKEDITVDDDAKRISDQLDT
jgi:hypothetical protein